MNLLIQKMMKNNLLVWFGTVALCIALSGCEKKEAEQPEQPGTNTPTGNEIPASFPRKHLIEEFTGQDCGYCPSGMDDIRTFTSGSGDWITVLHHYGFYPDHFSVIGSQRIMNQLNVDGAPSITIDRNTTSYGNSNGVVFHPTYLSSMEMSQFAQTTYASVVINNGYDAATRRLDVTVSGALCKVDYPNLMLTVLVKESGMIDYQKDYYKTFEGWSEFRHTNAVRAFLTRADGDTVKVDDTRHYTATYSLTLGNGWKAENCMVVAFLSEGFSPLVQTEEQPVVAGTKGGSDLVHCGIKAVEVPDYYPEPDAVTGASVFTGKSEIEITTTRAFKFSAGNTTIWNIEGYNESELVTIQNGVFIPYFYLSLYTAENGTTITPGTYKVNSSCAAWTVLAGYRDDNKQSIGGSMFLFAEYTNFKNGTLRYNKQWLIADGTLTVAADSTWVLDAHTLNGSSLRLKGVKAIQY